MHLSSIDPLVERLRAIEEGRVLPTFSEFVELCRIYGRTEHLNLKALYPTLYEERRRHVEQLRRSGKLKGPSPLREGKRPSSVAEFYDWCIQEGIARNVNLSALFPELRKTDPKGEAKDF